MKKKNKNIVVTKFRCLFIVLFFILVALSSYLILRVWENNRVVSVSDGDSIGLSDGRRIRLLALDAPERGRCMADEAREGLTKLVLGRHVRLKNTVNDSYGRMLAIVIIEDFSTWMKYLVHRFDWSDLFIGRIGRIETPDPDPLINRAMIRGGFARYTSSLGATSGYADTFSKAVEEAKNKKLGIWSDQCRSASSPPAGKMGPGFEAEHCTIKGNLRAGEKRYYLPTCKEYDQVIVDLSYGDAWFCTQTDAESAGFVKAPGCR